MKKHFFNRFYLKNRLFHEGRLVFKGDGRPTEGAADAKPEKPAGTTEARPDGVGAKPEGAPEAKPAGERALDILRALYEKEKLQEKERDSAPERALKALHTRLKRKGFEKTFIDEALASGNAPKLEELAIILLKDPTAPIAPSKLNAVAAELETLIKPKGGEKAATARHESTAERAGLKGQIERGQLKEELPQLPELPIDKKELEQKLSDFNKILDSGDEQKALDPIKIAVKRENYQINADEWDHSSTDGLRQILLDCKRVLGNGKIISPFYTALFATLGNAADPTKNRWLAEPGEDYVSWFKDPLKYREQLMGLPADANFYGGEQFVRAYEHLHYLKSEVLHSQDVAHVATLAKQEGLDSDPVATKVTDFVRDNVAKFSKAIRERDYATAGMYAVGIWALYKSIKELTGGKDSKITKYLIYGIGAYAGYTFAKNAGYDILKIAGFKDKDFEVKGTPFEVMKRFVSEKPEYKDFDYSVAFRMSEVRLKDLHKMLEETNRKGDFFIHPKDFPGIFPDLVKEWPFDMGLGEKGLGDTEGMGNKKLSAAQREYLRVGRQIYLTAQAMEEIYNQTLYKDHPDYKNIPYEQAIKNPELKGMAKVRHLLWAAQDYSPEGAQRLFSEKTTEEAQGHINAIFEGKDAAATVEELLGQGHYSGYLKGFPVVFVRDKDSYRVYLRNDYNGLKNPGTKATRIPIEGPTRPAMADKAIEAVDKRMEELMAPLVSSGGRMLKKPEYKDSKWQTEVRLPGAAEFTGKGKPVMGEKRQGILKVRADGKGVTFLVPGTPVRVNIDRGIEGQYEASLGVLRKIVDQREFHALQVFDNARRLRIEDPKPGDKKLTLLIGKSKQKLEVEFDPAKDEFKIVGGQKVDVLIKSPAFRKDYLEALNADELFELNETASQLKDLIKQSCPEKFLAFFFQSLANQTLRGPLAGFNTDSLSGTIPDNFTNMIIDTKRQEAFHKLYRAMEGATDFQTVETLRKDILADLHTELGVLYDEISRENRRMVTAGEEWGRMEFMLKVVDKIRGAGSKSTQYSLARVDLEYAAYNMNLPGFATASEFNEASHAAVGELINVFTFHTAYLDSADLDNLTYKPTPTPGYTGNPKDDPALKGHYILNYLAYVKDRIVNEAPKITGGKSLSPDLIPDPSDPRWKIESFENWPGTYEALDPLDNLDPFEHDLDKHKDKDPAGNPKKPEYTALDEELKRRIEEAVGMLKTHLRDDLNLPELEKYLNNKRGKSQEDMGLFVIYPHPVTKQPHSHLWETTDNIAQTAGTRCSVQIKLMDQKVNQILDFIFTAKQHGKLRFFIEKPGIWEKIKKIYYKIKYKLNI